jgi:hypothetical protein
MTWLRRQWLPLSVLVIAVGSLIASIAWVVHAGRGPAGTGPGPMMGGAAIAGGGPVRDMDDAKRAAARFADRWGLTVGEVMQFDNGFYAELADRAGTLATEVLIDPDTGDVQIEYGPAMMWNTAYGMHPARAAAPAVSVGQAKTIADQWLAANRPGEHASDAEAFPGYYTLHTLSRDDQVVGMLSVHASAGTVWPHTWHGRFIAMTD